MATEKERWQRESNMVGNVASYPFLMGHLETISGIWILYMYTFFLYYLFHNSRCSIRLKKNHIIRNTFWYHEYKIFQVLFFFYQIVQHVLTSWVLRSLLWRYSRFRYFHKYEVMPCQRTEWCRVWEVEQK